MKRTTTIAALFVATGVIGMVISFVTAILPMAGPGFLLTLIGVGLFIRREKTRQSTGLISIVLIILVAVAGCTQKVVLKPEPGYLGVAERLPVRAALLIPETVKDYKFVGKPESVTMGMSPHEFPLGLALEEASMQIFSQVFDRLQLVRLPADAKKFDMILEPMVEDFHFRYDQLTYAGFAVSVLSTVKLKVTLSTGETRIWERSVESPEQRKGPWVFDPSFIKKTGESASDALVYCLRKIALDMVADGQVQRTARQMSTPRPSVAAAKRPEPPPRPVERPRPPIQAASLATAAAPAADVAQRWAVIVGVSDYKDSQIPALRYAAADAKAFYDYLVSPDKGRYAPSHVKLLIDRDATGRNIKEALYVWLKQAIEEDLITIYFAGHGSPESPDNPENLFLLPYDTHYENIAATGFPMWDIETALKRFIKAKRVIVIADACHAGGVGQSFDVQRRAARGVTVNPISSGIQNITNVGTGVCVITASDDKQFSQEDRKWGGGHGVFTYCLLEGLKGAADFNDDKRVTMGELTLYLSQEVRRETQSAQCPTVSGKFDPMMTIGR
ncbi:MAG: caspase family protein [Deltaproteobacteria bacterium]|nr:caspase family protein [Deltaproteobacteria bacterium]